MSLRAEAFIDTAALKHNFNLLSDLIPESKKLAVIKANAYGHGLKTVATALSAADGFAVANISEGIALRNLAISIPIIILQGFLEEEEYKLAAKLSLTVVVHHISQIEIIENVTLDKPISVWLKASCGMNRIGFSPQDFLNMLKRLRAVKWVDSSICLMTHLPNADLRSDKETVSQMSQFYSLIENSGCENSIANSATIMGWRKFLTKRAKSWIRPGIMLYGISPFGKRDELCRLLIPVMSLESRLIAINQHEKGQRVGYGGVYICEKKTVVGTISIGYGDGYPRHARQGTPVLIRGQFVPLIGRVSMDMITVDLTEVEDVVVGDRAILWGKNNPVEKIAEYSDTIPYELVCQVTQRVNYRCKDDI